MYDAIIFITQKPIYEMNENAKNESNTKICNFGYSN